MLSRTLIFLFFVACFVLNPVIVAAQGGPAYLIEIDLEGTDGAALRTLEGVRSGHLSLAGRTADMAYLHASGSDLETLSGLGIEFDVITEESLYLEYYIIDKDINVEDALEWSAADVLREHETFYLVSVEPENAFGIHLLRSKARLTLPAVTAVPFRLSERTLPEAPAAAMTYSPAIQAMVDLVSQSRLYSLMRELTGETSVVVGGQSVTIHTRYSYSDLCLVAGHYLKERFEAIGLETEFHYFNYMRTLKSLYFPGGNQTGWAVGKSGIILRTDDGGDTWNPQESGLETALNDVFMIDEYAGWIAGNGGEILWTADGGATWNAASTPTGADLNKVYFTDASTGYCCGTGGTMLKSTDGGVTWFSLSSGTGNDLSAVVFVNSTEGWAVGEGGKIIRTANGGTSWSNVSSPTSDDLMDITFVGESDGWISTATGNVLKTEDGASWQQVVTPVSTSLRSISFASNGLTGWACGPDGGLVKTNNGGDTWNDLSIYSLPVLWDVCFVSSTEGWMCGSAYLLHSENGALDWEDQRVNVQDGDVNVIATIPGTVNPDEIYIICGHFDCTSNNAYNDAPGADDNGTGTLAALEAARALREHEYEATIRFACFSREEQGLVGSNAYAAMCARRGENVAGVLNFDMIGYVDEQPEEIEILHDSQSAALAAAFGQSAALYATTLNYRIRFSSSRSSDHASFWDEGYPAFCGIEDSPLHNPYYHRTTDRVGTLDFDFYEDVVRAGVALLAELARIDSTSAGVPVTASAGHMKILPNPCIGGAKIEFAGNVSPEMSLEFYDIQGRLVGNVRPEVAGSRATAVWNADGENGEPLSPGIYFVKVAGAQESRKIILLK
jgi:photosystem II stability/assembly factor-like uncharacterized protein